MGGRMAKHPHLTSDQVVLRALRELCKGAGERLPHPKLDAGRHEPETTELPSSVRSLHPEDER
jgi:hypothetical protein